MQSSRLVSISVLQRSRVISTATNRRPATFAAAAPSNIWSWWLGPMMTTTTTMTTKRCAGGTTTSSDRSDSSRSSTSSSVGPNARRGSGGNNSSGSSKQSTSPQEQQRRPVPPQQPSPHPPADAAAIAEFSRDLSRLHQQDQFYRTPPSALPALWESQPTPLLPPDRRQRLWDEVARLVDRLHNRLIERPVIRPDRKYRREVSMIEERLLQHLVSCVYDGSTDVYPLVETILSLMSRFQMDPFYSHCEAAVYIAAREGRWSDAAKLYQNLYADGEATYPLEDPTMGLYCIARHAKQAGALPVESVLDAVAKLSAKGTDSNSSEKYVLAAGVALGRVGEWEGLRNYLKTSYIANQFGQPLVAATMEACVLSGQPAIALAIFDELEAGELAAAVKWQWDGGSAELHAASRDAAIRAIGELDDPTSQVERMLTLYRQAENDSTPLSWEANQAVLQALSRLGMVEESVAFFMTLLDKDPKLWLLPSKELFVTKTISSASSALSSSSSARSQVDALLLNVMDSCNSYKKFGLALLCLRLFQVSLVFSEVDEDESISLTDVSPVVRSLVPAFSNSSASNRLIATTMTALCGVQAPHEAIALYDTLGPLENDACCGPIRKYAKSMLLVIDPTLVHSWSYVHRHIDRITAAIMTIERSQERLLEEDMSRLSAALATTVADCTAAACPETGLALGKWVDNRKLNVSKRMEDTPNLFSDDDKNSNLPLSDALLSSVIGAYRASGATETAEGLIKNLLFGSRSPTDWMLSYQEAVDVLYEKGESQKATVLFKKILAFNRSPGFFLVAARGLIKSGSWRGVVEVYKLALSSGCASEELGFLAMESVAASGRIGQKDGQLPFLRSIIVEVSKLAGTTPRPWIVTNYWKFRRLLGFSTARLIMGWDDYQTSRLDELELALENLYERASAGLTPKHSVLFSILKGVANYDTLKVPYNRTGLPRIPRNIEGWAKILHKTIEEAQTTMIINEPRFIDGLATASLRLGLHKKCLEIVSDAVARGVRVNHEALKCANEAAVALGIPGVTGDFRLLLKEAQG